MRTDNYQPEVAIVDGEYGTRELLLDYKGNSYNNYSLDEFEDRVFAVYNDSNNQNFQRIEILQKLNFNNRSFGTYIINENGWTALNGDYLGTAGYDSQPLFAYPLKKGGIIWMARYGIQKILVY